VVVGVLALIAAVLVALPFALKGKSADEKQSETLVKSSTESMQTVLRSIGQATNRRGLEFAGTGAQGTLSSLAQVNARVVDVKDPAFRAPVGQLLQAETAVVQAFARFGEMAKKRRRPVIRP
jgi:hypothetical protein